MKDDESSMEKLQQLCNIIHENGEVVTYFGGKVTQSQLITIVVGALGVFLVLRCIKGVIKLVCMVGVICVALVITGLASPDQLKDTATIMKENGIHLYENIASASENIRLDGSDIEIKIGNEWYNLSNIQSVVSTAKNKLSVTIDGKSLSVDDWDLVNLINSFR